MQRGIISLVKYHHLICNYIKADNSSFQLMKLIPRRPSGYIRIAMKSQSTSSLTGKPVRRKPVKLCKYPGCKVDISGEHGSRKYCTPHSVDRYNEVHTRYQENRRLKKIKQEQYQYPLPQSLLHTLKPQVYTMVICIRLFVIISICGTHPGVVYLASYPSVMSL